MAVAEPKSSRSGLLSLCILLFVVGIVCIQRLPTVNQPAWNVDETIESLVAQDMIHGKIIYQDTITHRAPLQHFLFFFLFKLFGCMNMTAVHYALVLSVLYIVGMLYLIGKYSAGPVAGGIAGLLFIMMTVNLPPCDTLAFHTEFLLAVFSSTAGLLLLTGLRKEKAGYFFAAGICLGLAFFSKQPGLLEMAGMTAFLAYESLPRERRSFFLRSAGCMAAGFAVVSLVFTSYFAAKHALRDFLYYFWSYNTDIYVGIMPVFDRIRAIGHFFIDPDLKRISLCMAFILFVYPFYLSLRYRAAPREERPLLRFLLVWMWFSYLGTALSGRNFSHYYIPPMIPASLIGGLLLSKLFGYLASSRKIALALLHGVILCGICFFSVNALFSPPKWRQEWFYKPIPDEIFSVSQYIRKNSSPEDTVFVWGAMPYIYQLSERMPASRYNQTNFLTGLVPWVNFHKNMDTSAQIVPGSWQKLLRDLETNQPLFIIDTSPGNYNFYRKYPMDKFPKLNQFVLDHYEMDRNFINANGATIIRLWRRKRP